MAGSVTGLHVFGPDTGPEALSLMDGNYGALTTAINTLLNYTNYYVDAGPVNAMVITVAAPQIFALTDGVALDIQVSNTTTSTTPTANVNGLGAKTIVCADGSALPPRALVAGGRYRLQYDGANFRALTVAGANASGTFASLTIGPPVSGATLTINAVQSEGVIVNGPVGLNAFSAVVAATGQAAGYSAIAGGQTFGVSDGFFAQANGGDVNLGVRSANNLSLFTNGGGRLVINSSGALTVNTPAAGQALIVNGVAGAFAGNFQGNSTSGQSFGLEIIAGTNSSDIGFLVRNQSTTANYFNVRGDGVLLGFGPVAGVGVDMTPDTSTFTGTITGMTTTPTTTCTWVRIGKLVGLNIGTGVAGISNVTTFTMTGLPAALQPATLANQFQPMGVGQNNSTATSNISAQISAGSGTVTFLLNGSNTGWFGGGGTKSISQGTIWYLLT